MRRPIVPSLMAFFFLTAYVNLLGCATPGERRLNSEEMKLHGLSAIIFDAPLCPTKFENGISRVSGPCEYVSCEQSGAELVCLARKRPKY